MTPGSVVLYEGEKWFLVELDGYRANIARRNRELQGLEQLLVGEGDITLVAPPTIWAPVTSSSCPVGSRSRERLRSELRR